MIKNKTIACVIPARLNSTRFPEKIIKNLQGKPVVQWVWEKANQCGFFDEVIIAVDDTKTLKIAENFSAKVCMTDSALPSGTMRLIAAREVLGKEFDYWLNWQADEPLLPKEMILDLINGVDGSCDVYTLKKKISLEDAKKPQIVKVITDKNNKALYFSRAEIPFIRDAHIHESPYYKHIGLYLYGKKALDKIKNFKVSDLEDLEKLEQLTFLYQGMSIKVSSTDYEGIGIDYIEDLIRAEKYLKEQNI